MKTKKQLVIVESPTKAKSIGKYLGKNFEVMACQGHIRDLPKSKFGVDIEHDFKPDFEIIKGKDKIIRALKEAIKNKDKVYIASDPDREGEAIAWHVAQVLGIPTDDDVRITFNEITENAIKRALRSPGAIDEKKVKAQFARRILDRIVGYKISPLLWRTIQRGLSAGRVQSVALKLLCDREKEIGDFVSQEYWEFVGIISSEREIEAKLVKYNDILVDKQYIATNSSQATIVKNTLMHSRYRVTSVKSVKKRVSPPNPYITSTLQQDAATKLNFSPTRTMQIAQQLYEGVESPEGNIALITYMRTDSIRVSEQAKEAAKRFIMENYGKEYCSTSGSKKKGKKSTFVQDAHEAIRPTYFDKTPDEVKGFLSRDQFKLYGLIWNRFIASQMAAGINSITTVTIDSTDNKHTFSIQVKKEYFDGFRRVWGSESSKKSKQLGKIPSTLAEGKEVIFEDIKTIQKFTQPPSRYTVASLIKKLEADGLGRPSTYATIFNTLRTRGYIRQFSKQQLRPTVLGIVVNEFLIKKFPKLIRVKFTSEMESELDMIERGNASHIVVLKKFYDEFDKVFTDVEKSIATGTLEKICMQTDYPCPNCGTLMELRYGKYGPYLHCSECDKSVNVSPTLTPGIKDKHILIKDILNNSNEEMKIGRKCPKCGGDLVIRQGKYGKFIGCSNYPKCDYTERYEEKIGVSCPKPGCDGEIVRRWSKRGKEYYICTNNPKSCDFISWDKPTNERCPICGDVLYERKNKLYCKTCKKWFDKK